MRKNKLAALMMWVLLAVLALSGQALALDSASPYHASRWTSYLNVTMYSVFPDYASVNSEEYSWRKFGSNCFYFARLVTKSLTGKDFSLQIDGKRAIQTSAAVVSSHRNENSGLPTESTIKQAFVNVKPGDVIQFVGWSSHGEHTMVVAAVYSDGFETLEGNNPKNSIVNGSWTYSQFSNTIAAATTSWKDGKAPGGFTIYRFSDVPVTPPAPTITTTSLPNGTVDKPYSAKVEATGENLTFSVNALAIANGLWIDDNGNITGTPKYERSTLNIIVTVSNSGGSDKKVFSIQVFKAPPVVTSDSYTAVTGKWFSQYLTATNSPTSWKIKKGSLPGGLNFDTRYGRIYGYVSSTAAPANGNTSTNYPLEVTATNAGGTSAAQKITIMVEHAVRITSPTAYRLPNAAPNTDYKVTFTAEGTRLGMSWAKVSGNFPAGVNLDAASQKSTLTGVRTATLSGKTNAVEKTYYFTIKASAGRSHAVKLQPPSGMSASRSYYITVTKPSISYNLYGGVAGRALSTSNYIQFSGWAQPYKWEVEGSIPPGTKTVPSGEKLTLAGKPTKGGTYNFTVRVTDANGATATKDFSVKITSPVINYDFYSHRAPRVGKYDSDYVYVYGGTTPYSWTYTGTLPPGMYFDFSGGYARLKGTPTKDGTYKFKLTVKDANKIAASKSFKLTVPKLAFYSKTFRTATINQSYNDHVWIDYSSGTPATPMKVQLKGDVPPGLTPTVSGRYVYLKGTPKQLGTYKFTLSGTDKNGANIVPKTFTVKVAKPTISLYSSFNTATEGTYYSGYAHAMGGTSYSWKTTGNLPPGVKPYQSGSYIYLRGTPTASGTFPVTLKVTDASGVSAQRKIEIYVAPKRSYALPNGDDNTASQKPRVTGAPQGEASPVPTPREETASKVGSGSKLSLKVASDDIVSVGEEGYEDIIEVEAGKPVTFEIDESVGEDVEVNIYINGKLLEDEKVSITEENEFTLPVSMISDDFRIYFEAGNSVSEELHISVVEKK